MNAFKKFLRKITFSDFRDYVIDNQAKHADEIKQLKDQIFQTNPVMILHDARIYLPYFYVDHIQKVIYHTGDFYEKTTLYFLKSHYPKIKHIVEVGANIGNHMLFYATQMHAEQVLCFEPNAFNRNVLEKNIALNHLENKVKVFPVALGASEAGGIQSAFDLKNTGMSKIEVAKEGAEKQIDIMPLDHYGFNDIHFIKIDVEGHELEVLKGALDTIMRNKPVVMVEVFDNNLAAAIQFFQSIGYHHKYTLEEHNFVFEYVSHQ